MIQEIDADMTNPAFVMRTAEADGHFLYTKLNEIDQFDALKGSTRGQQQFQIMCLAFDPGNRYGQTRVGAASVTEKVCVRFNWNASTTILKGKRYFSRVLTDGPVSRINFCTIPEREIGAEMPVYGSYGPEFDEELRPYIDCLCRASGEIDCPEAWRLALQLREECADCARLTQSRVYENLSFRALVIAWLKACVLYVASGCQWDPTFDAFVRADCARLTQSRVYENLSFRALVIAWLKACVLYVASGCQWDPTFDAFVRWSLQYDLWCKMEFFGTAIQEANMAGDTLYAAARPGRRNLLSLLPPVFSLAEAVSMRKMEFFGTAIQEANMAGDTLYAAARPGRRNLLSLLPPVFSLAEAVSMRVSQGLDADGTCAMLRQWRHRGYVQMEVADRAGVQTEMYRQLKN